MIIHKLLEYDKTSGEYKLICEDYFVHEDTAKARAELRNKGLLKWEVKRGSWDAHLRADTNETIFIIKKISVVE